MSSEALKASTGLSFEGFKQAVLNDFRIANESRQTSLLGRKEVLTGKAKFGIFGDGKEVAQIAMAKVFRAGDFRSGYYRDQTFMMAIGALSLEQYFAGLYGDADINRDPMSGGRQMGGHFATQFIDEQGNFLDLVNRKNSSSDISPTAGQMPRLLGLAYASHFFRVNKDLQTTQFSNLSNKGNEVAFGTIGDASTSEGPFWETMNAAAVLQVPLLMSVWDDGHGISVPKKYQTTKESISEALAGFQRTKDKPGFEIFVTKGWNYAHLCETYEKAIKVCREEHVPVLVHVEEVTQPQGHSTSGSHERYKSKERLQWETDFDCVKQLREWILQNALATEAELNKIEEEAKTAVSAAKTAAWKAYLEPIKKEITEVAALFAELETGNKGAFITPIKNELLAIKEPIRKDIHTAIKRVLRLTKDENSSSRNKLSDWLGLARIENDERYSSIVHSNTALHVSPVAADYENDQKQMDGREILRDNFDAILAKYPQAMVFGEDAGKIGGVNQGLEGLQKNTVNTVFLILVYASVLLWGKQLDLLCAAYALLPKYNI